MRAGDCARLLRQVKEHTAQLECNSRSRGSTTAESTESIIADDALHADGFRSVSPALFASRAAHCCGIPADSSSSFDPSPAVSGVSRPSQASVCVPHFVHLPQPSPPPHSPPPHHLPAHAIAAAPRAPVAIAASARPLPPLACLLVPGYCAPCEAPGFACLAAFARAPAATPSPSLLGS